jgi:PAS domain S-box-containing protein
MVDVAPGASTAPDGPGGRVGAGASSRPTEVDGCDPAERALALERLEQSEERFRSLVEFAPDAIALHHDGILLEANPAFAAMFGVPRDEMMGRHVAEFGGQAFEDLLLERELTKATEPVVAQARRQDGARLSFELRGHSVHLNGKGARTITLRDRTAEMEREAQFGLIFEESPLGIGLAGPDFMFIRVNDAFCRIFGFPEDELLTMTFVDVTHPDDAVELVGRATAMYAGTEPRMFSQSRGVRKDGTVIWFQVTASVIKAMDGEILYAIGMVEDITERKHEQELLDTFFSTSADMMCVATFEGYFKTVNEAWTKTLGWTTKELCSTPFLEFIHPDDVGAADAAYADQMAAGEPVISFENRYRCRDGSYRWMEWNAVTIPEQRIIVCNVRDTTAVKALAVAAQELNAELARSNAELEQFAYVASHDLQEPLRMVASYVQLLQRRYKGQLDSDADEFIGFAVDGATRMQSLIQDLLSYSRLGRKPRPFVPVDMSELVDGLLGTIALTIEENDAVVTHRGLPVVMGDPTQLTQLVQNLVGNALKYRGETSPVVTIGAEQGDDEWTFTVTDNGIGIDPAYSERIFSMFQRLHGRDEFSGTGIGLAISKRVADLHGGRIWVEPGPAGGSVFRFTLPVRPNGGPRAVA